MTTNKIERHRNEDTRAGAATRAASARERGWAQLTSYRGGHRLFAHRDGGVFIADESGQTPADCDDGPLQIDTTTPRAAVRNDSGVWEVPVLTAAGVRAWVRIRDYTRGDIRAAVPGLEWID